MRTFLLLLLLLLPRVHVLCPCVVNSGLFETSSSNKEAQGQGDSAEEPDTATVVARRFALTPKAHAEQVGGCASACLMHSPTCPRLVFTYTVTTRRARLPAPRVRQCRTIASGGSPWRMRVLAVVPVRTCVYVWHPSGVRMLPATWAV